MWKSILSGVLALASGFVASAQTLPVTSAGYTPGTFDVSNTGQATYSIPLWSPPGTQGVEPHLALTYFSNNRAKGWISPGWSLSGISQITRCQKTIEYDGRITPVYLTADDAFCLDGVRLELYTGTYAQPGSTYRAKVEQFSLVTAKEVAGNGPAWFEVMGKDGLIYEYGRTGNSRALLSGGTTPYLWSLSKVRDRRGNNLIVEYTSSSGAVSLANIQYTQSPAASTGYPYAIVFNYSARDADDTLTGYIAGSQFSMSKRLDSVDVRYGGTTGALLRQYRLTYTESPTTQRSRLAAVQECGGSSGADCLAPTTISYQNGQVGVAAPSAISGFMPTYSELRVADLNGDGYSDLIYSRVDVGFYEWYVLYGGPSGFAGGGSTGIRIASDDRVSEVLVGDFFGSGSMQILAPDLTSKRWCIYSYETGWTAPNCTSFARDDGVAGDGATPTYASADVNGDGRADLVWVAINPLFNAPYVFVRLNTGRAGNVISFSEPISSYPVPDTFAGLYGAYGPASVVTNDRLDFNGDSREDVVLVTQSGQVKTARQLIAAGDGIPGSFSFATGPTLANYLGWPQGINWNDDACTDMRFTTLVYISACNGALGQTISVNQGNLHLDWNGDGRGDVLYASGSSWSVQLSQGTNASAALSTGIPYVPGVDLIPLDYDADGALDLLSVDVETRALGLGLHRGAGELPDLASSIVDGHGNRFSPTYKPITKGSYTANYPGAAASAYPNVAFMTPLYVVDQFSATDGTGGTYTNQFQYWSARRNLRGLGFLGFAARRTIDSRTGLSRTEEYSQSFGTTGWLTAERVATSGGAIVQSVTNIIGLTTFFHDGENPFVRTTYFPYVQKSTSLSYEFGGPNSGALISTREITNSYDSWGTQLSQTVKTTEGATGLNSGAVYTEISSDSDVLNDTTNWCLSKPRRSQQTRRHTLTGGADVTRTTSYSWDAVNCRLDQEIVEPDSTRWAVTTAYGYDAVGNVDEVTITPAAGQGQSARGYAVSWGTDGRFPRTVTNPKSQVTSFGWDVAKGVRTSVTDPNNVTITRGYDNFNRMNRESRPDGTATDISRHLCSPTYVYCASADIRMYVQTITRDSASNVIRTDIQSFDGMERPRYSLGNLLTGAMRGEIKTYNSLGMLSTVSMPFIQGEPVWYSTIGYDALGRPTSVQRPISEANSSSHLTQLSYRGLSVVKTDALNRTTAQWLNALSETVRIVDTGNGATNYEYDAFGNVLKVTDAASNESTMTYNVRGMKMTSNDPDLGAWTYDYYPLGELKSQTDAKSQTTTFTYDVLSRLLTRLDGDGTTQLTYDTSANGVGQRATASSPGGYSEAYSYDTRGRLSQTRVTADSTTYQYDYGYSSSTGLLESLTYPTSSSGFRFKVRYDYQYGLMQKVSNYTGDVLGEAYWEGIATNARGQYIDEQLGNGLRSISGYDRIAGWLDDRTTARTGGSSLQNFTYQWDALGNLKQRQDSYNNVTENFYYDSLDRLDYSTLNGTTNLDLAYDSIGNITSKSGVGSYTYHPTKRHAVVSTAGTSNNTFAYDANGNMETRNGQPITWYRNNLPKKISASTTLSNEFWYGPDGARWKQVTTNGTSIGTWTYIGGLVERLVTTSVNEFRHYIVGPSGVVAVYKRPSSGISPTTTYVTTDHLDSLDVITNTAGVEVADAGFSAFGERLHYTGSGPPPAADLTAIRNTTRRGFTFHEHLDEVGLIHMNGRVYDPVIARFISADPFVQEPFNSQSLNRYSYVLNNPLRYTDPSGYFGWDSIGNFFNGIGQAIGIIRLWRDLWRTPPSCSDSCDWNTSRGGGSDEYSGGIWSPIIFPSPPGSTSPSPETNVIPANPILPRADAAVPGMGQPADVVSLQPGDATQVCQSVGYMTCLPTTRSKADVMADQQGELASAAILVIGPELAIEAVLAARAARLAKLAAAGKKLPPLRQQYVAAVEALAAKVPIMRAAGMSSEQIARTLHAERRAIGEVFKALTPPEKLAEIYARNIAKYGDKLGPSIEWLRARGKTWEEIIESATRVGGKDLGF